MIGRTDLAYYSGEDKLNLPLLSVGAVGVVGVVDARHRRRDQAMIEAYERGRRRPTRWRSTADCSPLFTGIFRTQGVDPGQGRA